MSTESRQARRWRERRTATRWPTTPFVLLGRMEDPGGAGAWAITGWRRRTRVMPPPACSKPGWHDVTDGPAARDTRALSEVGGRAAGLALSISCQVTQAQRQEGES